MKTQEDQVSNLHHLTFASCSSQSVTQHFMGILVLWKDDLLYGYHVNCILDNYLIQQYIPYHICPVVVICADHCSAPDKIKNLFSWALTPSKSGPFLYEPIYAKLEKI